MKPKENRPTIRVADDSKKKIEELADRFDTSAAMIVRNALAALAEKMNESGGKMEMLPKKATPTHDAVACAGKIHHNSPCPVNQSSD